MLANLCVLIDYNQQIEYCKVHLELVNAEPVLANTFYDNAGYKKGQPWLYYLTNNRPSPGNEILQPQKQRVQFRATFDTHKPESGVLNKLKFKLASYNLTGHFLGFETLTDQLFVCEPQVN